MLQRMRSGAPALGVGLRQARTVDVGRAMVTAGADWLFIDLEHTSMHLDTAVQIAVAAEDAGITPVVRVPKGDFALACRVLDGGAVAIVMPHVDNGAEAAAFARACRYPPQGSRSIAAALPQIGFRSLPFVRAVAEVEAKILLFPMVETREGAQHVEAIAATPGLDGILLGLGDLSIELGVPGEVAHPDVRAAVQACIAACRRHGKWVGFGGAGDPAIIKDYTDLGMNFVLMGSDLAFLVAGVAARVALLRGTGR